jgi:anaerobic magnesium-protoporphyrin IX monomethyl ester cyclase
MLKISLIAPNIRYGSQMLWSVLPSRGLLSLGAVLRDAGFSCQFIDADIDNLSNTDVIRRIETFSGSGSRFGGDCNVVCITMNSFQAYSGLELAGHIRNWSDVTGIRTVIIVGGPHASAMGKILLVENRCVDILCKGESEETIVELMRSVESDNDFSKIKGISYRLYDDVYENSDRSRIQNIDSIPFPAYELVGNIGKYPGAAPVLRGPSMHIMASRGCPFSCTFCSSQNVWGHIIRFRSPQNIVDEVEMLHTRYGINEVFFQDDTMNVNREWFFSVCNEIINRKKAGRLGCIGDMGEGMDKGMGGMTFKAPFRVNSSLIDMELLLKAKEAGFWIIFYGVESGNQKVLDIIEKGTTVDEVRRAFALTHNAGIRTIAAFMVGNIGDTVESVDDSIRLAKEICVRGDVCGFSIACPLPGTEFYRIAKEKGWIENLDYRNYSTFGAVARNEALTAGQIAELAGRANGEVYRHING